MARITGFVTRAAELIGPADDGEIPPAFAEAMDDDLSVPAALAILQDTVTSGQRLLGEGPGEDLRAALGSVRAMLDVLGLDPLDPQWASGRDQGAADAALGTLVQQLLDHRAEARASKDFAAADRIRDQLTAAGVAIEDTPQGARWSVKEDR